MVALKTSFRPAAPADFHDFHHSKSDPYGKATVLDASGNPKADPTYSEYGNPWTFTGRRLDGETGLMYFRNRMYETGLGRFVSRDPWRSDGPLNPQSLDGYPTGYSLYSAQFVPNSLDPSGEAGATIPMAVASFGAFLVCMYPQALAAKRRYGHRSDKFRHCWTSCRMAKICGMVTSEVAGLGKEGIDSMVRTVCHFYPKLWICQQGHGDWLDSLHDILANQKCIPFETAVPLAGWVTSIFRESCECCCTREVGK